MLLIDVKKDISVKVGALGELTFKKGLYVYVGSAQNSLEKRVSRHMSKHKKLRWHVDYLLSNKHVKIKNVFYKEAPKSEEDKTACKLLEFGTPIPKFGASDSKCISHLFKVKSSKELYTSLTKWGFLNQL